MLSPADLVRLPFTADLTEGGIAYALRGLSRGDSSYSRIRRAVANAAVELAFRRYLSRQNIPFETASPAPFADHERSDVSVGGRRCNVKSFLISRREQIAEMRRNPQVLLNAPALVPSDLHAQDGQSDRDLYVFAFASGLIDSSQNDRKKIIEANLSRCLIYLMPEKWRQPLNWNPLGALILKSESDEEISVEISGQNEGREFFTRQVILPPKTRVLVDDSFYSLVALRVKTMPLARLGIYLSSHRETYLVAPAEWENIWVYGMDIYLAGFITRKEFRQRAEFLPPNSRTFQYDHTRVKNLATLVSKLKPMHELGA